MTTARADQRRQAAADLTAVRRVAESRDPYCGRNTASVTIRWPVKRAQTISFAG